MAFTSISVSAQVNSWINPASGNWDDASSWSLGVLPNSSQSVLITNTGWKAVAINPSTPVNFPDSMTVSNLTIQGSTNTENSLLLNYFGTTVPLTVLNGLTVEDDAQILNFDSALVVQGGTILVTNSQINQDGGLVLTTNAQMDLSDAVYDLTNGIFEAGVLWVGMGPVSGQFNQYGGTASIATLDLGTPTQGSSGAYNLYGGNLNLPGGLSLSGANNSFSSYFQSGGTNQTTLVSIEPGIFGVSPSFTLNGGLLADDNITLMADNFGTVTVNQNGGSHVVTNTLLIEGGSPNGEIVLPATYNLNGGTLSAGNIELNANEGDSFFVQSNAITSAQTFYAQSQGYFSGHNTHVVLAGGTFSCVNYTTDDGNGTLDQSGGALIVSNLLQFGGSRNVGVTLYGRYTFTGGTVNASNINITGIWTIGDGSTPRISNPGYFSLSHALQIGNATEQLGHFILASNATINLAGNASRLSFAYSSGETWAGGATLVITNWNGNLSGGGAEQLRFGTDSMGLTAAQLNQIQFIIGTNVYSAKILSTGEVVPNNVPPQALAFSSQGNNLVLNWPPGWTLQSATNVPGPYVDVSGATAPYTNDTALAQRRFFRLRQ